MDIQCLHTHMAAVDRSWTLKTSRSLAAEDEQWRTIWTNQERKGQVWMKP